MSDEVPERPIPDSERHARLVDVAKLANVSRATAARALGSYGLVSDSTRERVLQVARALDYRPNEIARAMRAGKTLAIGVVIADISNPFFSAATRAIIDSVIAAGYHTLVLNSDDDLGKEIEAVRLLVEKRVDGLIVVPSSPLESEHLVELSIPVVLLDRRVRGDPLPTVITDDRQGAEAAIELFLKSGHTRIGMLVATAAAHQMSSSLPIGVVSTVADRYGGACLALQKAGNIVSPKWIRFTRSHVDSGREAALDLLASDPRPTAVLASNEEMGLGIIAACHDIGLVVGRDISVVIFGDPPWARAFSPAVSVVQRPNAVLGVAAAECLLQELKGSGPASSRVFPTVLINRDSVGPPPL
jgi:LacI family transcriptional regulator